MSRQRGGSLEDITKDACFFYYSSAVTLTESNRT